MKYRVGDKVRVIKQTNFGNIPVGHILVVDDIDYGNNDWTFSTKQDDSKYDTSWYWQKANDECFELVEEESKQKFKVRPEQKFSVGDRVKIIKRKSGNQTGCEGNSVGVECYIKKIGSSGNNLWSQDFTTSYYGWFDNDEIELITSETSSTEECSSCNINGVDFSVSQNGLKEFINGNEPTVSSIKKDRNIMSKLTSFVKNSLFSADEKLLRKYDLKDSCGDYTDEAEELVIDKLIKDNEAYLIEVATNMEAEEKKNK